MNEAEINEGQDPREDPQVLFRRYDVDGSGTISLEEFRLMLPKLEYTYPLPKVCASFATMMRTILAALTTKSSLRCCLRATPMRILRALRPILGLVQRMHAFHFFDTDRSGEISSTICFSTWI